MPHMACPEVHLVRNIPESRPAPADSGPGPDHFRQRFGIPAGGFIALYQGAFTYNRGLETALQAMEGLEDSGIHLVLMGYGPLQPLVDATRRAPSARPRSPSRSVRSGARTHRSADLGLVSVKPTCLSYLYCLPNKLFEYILAGLPVLSNDLPDCRALIEEFQVGHTVTEDTAEGWRSALLNARAQGTSVYTAGLSHAATQLSWPQEAHILSGLYSEANEGLSR